MIPPETVHRKALFSLLYELRSRQPARQSAGQLRAARRLERREVRSNEMAHVHGLWHLDFHQVKIAILDTSGRWHRPMALAVCDDCSRLITWRSPAAMTPVSRPARSCSIPKTSVK
jgi:hypothetical protein